MPRVLPWLSRPSEDGPSRRPNPAAPPSAKKRRTISPVKTGLNNDIDIIEPATPPSHNDELPSSPTMLAELEPLEAPTFESMIEGYDADDGYMMVEDEFYSTARLFTKHLHQEEYIRLKKLAKSRMPEAIEDTRHPVDSATAQPNGVKLKMKAGEHSKAVKRGLQSVEADSAPTKPTFLTRLMQKDNSEAVDLSSLMKTKVKTKASIGVKAISEHRRGVEAHSASDNTSAVRHDAALGHGKPGRYSNVHDLIAGAIAPRMPMVSPLPEVGVKRTVAAVVDDLDLSDLDAPTRTSRLNPNARVGSGEQQTSRTTIQKQNVTAGNMADEADVDAQDAFAQRVSSRSSVSDFLAKRRAKLEQRQQGQA